MSIPLQQLVGGKYEILHKIKEGGVGVIYKVRHRLLDEEMVIKVLRQQLAFDSEMVQRFQNEAKSAIRLHHRNIARIHDFSADPNEGIAFIVMEFIDGVSLEDMLRSHGPASLELTIEISRQFLNALGYLHDHGIVHRDVAADNIMLSRTDSGEPLVKLIDLGIAKSEATTIGLTSTGVYLGKFHYSSPEHFATGSKDPKVERRSDLYSFGVLLYRLLTGHYPVRGNDFRSLAAGHLFRDPVPFSETDPEGKVPPGLASVVLKAMAKDINDRIASAEQFSLDLAEYAGSGPYRPELDAIFADVEDSAKPAPSERPGSTQERIDDHFKATDETAEGLVSEERELQPSRSGQKTKKIPAEERGDEALEAGKAAWQVDRAIQEERLDDAEEALARALERHGEIEVLVGLRERLDSRRKAEAAAADAVPAETEPPQTEAKAKPKTEAKPPKTEAKAKKAAKPPKTEAKAKKAAKPPKTEAKAKEEAKPPKTEAKPKTEAQPPPVETQPPPAETQPPPAETEPPPAATGPPPLEDKPPPAETQLLTMPEIDPPATQLLSPEELPGAEAVRRAADRGRDSEPVWPRVRESVATVPAKVWAGLSVALLLAAALGIWLSRPEASTNAGPAGNGGGGTPAATEGRLVLNALPWAEITAIEGPDGPRELPEKPFTPLALSLPPGSYTVTLTHPSADEPRKIEVQLGSGTTTSEQVEFAQLDADEYFRRIGW